MVKQVRGVVRGGDAGRAPAIRSAPPGPLSPAAVRLVDRARAELGSAQRADDPAEEDVLAHLAALRAGAAVLAARGRPRLRGQRALNVWDALAVAAPELEDWAVFFAACATRRAAAESGRGAPISAREAGEHAAHAGAFVEVVARSFDLPAVAQRLPVAS